MKKSVLVIDDDYFVRTLLTFLLRDHYEVITFENGLKAMLWMDKGNFPDLVLSDIDMPGLDGIKLLKQLRKSGYYRDVPVLLLSGLPIPDLKEKCLQAGATACLAKPFNPPELLNLLNKILQEDNAREGSGRKEQSMCG